MMDEPVVAFDIGRMFLGDEPPLFLLEIAFRTTIIYAYTLLLMRWLGSRSIGQLSLVEFLLVIALGSAVGDAMFYPDVPLLHCMMVITVVVLLDKSISFFVSRSRRVEDIVEGRSMQIVRDGVMNCAAMNKLNFGHDELFEQLRLNKIANLNQVRAAYLETNGALSVFKAEGDVKPGLGIEPPWDVEEPTRYLAGSNVAAGRYACVQCGNVAEQALESAMPLCPNCQGKEWHRVRG